MHLSATRLLQMRISIFIPYMSVNKHIDYRFSSRVKIKMFSFREFTESTLEMKEKERLNI